MEERIDEAKGNLKRGAGKLTGDEELEARGSAEARGARAQRQTKGAANKIKGSVKEGVGNLTDDEAARAEGTADRLKGEAQQRG